jgi:hypothetical protein
MTDLLNFLPGIPVKCAKTPEVNESCKQDGDEDGHLDIACPSNFMECYRPSEDEYGFKIKNHKEKSD